MDFDPGPGTYTLTSQNSDFGDNFASQLDSAGNFVWAKQFGANAENDVGGVALDSDGHVYTVGWLNGTMDFDPGPGVHNLTSVYLDPCILKLDSAGNFVWGKSFSGGDWDQAHGVAVDPGGNVYTVGEFVGTLDFDPGPETYKPDLGRGGW